MYIDIDLKQKLFFFILIHLLCNFYYSVLWTYRNTYIIYIHICTHTYIHYIYTYITYIHTHTLHTYTHTYIHYTHTYTHTLHTYISYTHTLHTYINCIHTLHIRIHTYIHTYRATTTVASPYRLHTSIYGHHTDWPHENCSNKMILAHFIVNRTILRFKYFITLRFQLL